MTQSARAVPHRIAIPLALAFAATGTLATWIVLTPRDPLARGRAAYARGSYHEAAALARERLHDAPRDREALRLVARASARLRQDRAVESLYSRLGPDGSEAEDYFLIGATLLRWREDGRALRMLEQARKADPNHAETLFALATEYARRDLELASADAARDLSSQPAWEARACALLGQQLLEIDDPEGAAAALARALQSGKAGEPPVLEPVAGGKLLTRALLRSGRPAEARAALQAVLAVGPDPEASWLLSRACLQEHDAAGAAAAIEEAGAYADDLDPITPEPAPFVGSSRCVGCHDAIVRSQQASRHAHTLAPDSDPATLPRPDRPIHDPGDSRVSHTITLAESQPRITVQAQGSPALEALITYVIGSGNRGRTPLVRDPHGNHYEYRLSHYAQDVGWDLTIHQPRTPDGDHGFLGKPLLPDNVLGCLGCHSTSARAARDGIGPTAAETGIGCERCHGPAGNHLAAMALKFPDPAIARPKIATGAERDALCAGCHRVSGEATESSLDLLRFQSPSLARSRCYTESHGALDCITCHNPHRDAETSPAYYESICLDCHAGSGPRRPDVNRPSSRLGANVSPLRESEDLTGEQPSAPPHGDPPRTSQDRQPSAAAASPRSTCPVSPTWGCLTCHMPAVPNVVPHTSYTDHFIRVREDHPRAE
jgi:tetratricopeptide (TPR) repeat protein